MDPSLTGVSVRETYETVKTKSIFVLCPAPDQLTRLTIDGDIFTFVFSLSRCF